MVTEQNNTDQSPNRATSEDLNQPSTDEDTMTDNEGSGIDAETRKRIRERVLEAEKAQLHLEKTHNIIPEIKEIIESEVDEVEEVSFEPNGGAG